MFIFLFETQKTLHLKKRLGRPCDPQTVCSVWLNSSFADFPSPPLRLNELSKNNKCVFSQLRDHILLSFAPLLSL